MIGPIGADTEKDLRLSLGRSLTRMKPNVSRADRKMHVLALGFLVALMGACSPSPPPADTGAVEAPLNAPEIPIPKILSEVTIGGVERAMRFVVRIHEDSVGPEIREKIVKTQKDDVAIVTVDISPPYPEHLWLSVQLGSMMNVPGHTLHMKTKVFVGDSVVDTFESTVGRKARTAMMTNLRKVDIFDGLDEKSGSILVRGESELSLFMNTDEDTFDFLTAQAPETMKVVIFSNPLRLNFE